MKCCINWRKSFKYMAEVDEYNIQFRNKETKLLNFLDTFATDNKKVNIQVDNNISDNELDIIISIAEMEKYNIAVCFPIGGKYQKIKEANIPFYFSTLVHSWENLNMFLDLGVESIFITGELGFDLKRVKELCRKARAKIRCYPNVCGASYDTSQGIKTFFIRPEDVYLYEPYIDVLEFWNSENKQNPLYEIYFQTQKWAGDLREIINGLTYPVNSYYILGSDFARSRIECRQRCIKGSDCNLCVSISEFANAIENSDDYEVYERITRNG